MPFKHSREDVFDVMKAFSHGVSIETEELDVHGRIVAAIMGFHAALAPDCSNAGVEFAPPIATAMADLAGGIKSAAFDEDYIFFGTLFFQDLNKSPKGRCILAVLVVFMVGFALLSGFSASRAL